MNLRQKINFHWTKKKTIILVSVLLVVLVGASIYFFFFKNTFSKEDIVLQISGPQDIVAGKEMSWVVNIKNKSEITIENIELVFEYPEGVFNDDGSIKKKEKKIIKKIQGGEEKTETFSGLIFGAKEEIKTAKVVVTYNPEGVSAFFQNDTSFSTRISDTSLVFLMDAPSKIEPGENISVSISWQSGFSFPLKNIQIRFSPPEGFERTSEKLEEEREESGKFIFDIGSVNENEGGKRQIEGRLNGEVGDEKLFKVEFGIFDEKLFEFIPLASVEKVVKIKTSALDASIKVNGEANYIASPGESLAFIVNFMNTGEDIYRGLSLTVELEGGVLDFSTLQAPGGKIEGKKIIFSSDNFPDLLFLGPYGEGSVGFTIKVKEYNDAFFEENALIKETIKIGTIEKSFQTKVSSKLSFKESVYSKSELLPPDVRSVFDVNTSSIIIGKENNLVIAFKIENYGNKLTDVKISGTLPENVYFADKFFPSNADIQFNKDKKELVLNIGNIPANFKKEYFVQLKITPTSVPDTIHNSFKLTGKDSWTGKIFEITIPSQTTDSL